MYGWPPGADAVILIALLILCGIADCVTTYIGLRQGDTEANPVASSVFKLLGPVVGMLILKCLCTAIICGVLVIRPHWWPLGALFLAGYAYVLFNNVKVIRS